MSAADMDFAADIETGTRFQTRSPEGIPDPCTPAIQRLPLITSDNRLLWRKQAEKRPREGAT